VLTCNVSLLSRRASGKAEEEKDACLQTDMVKRANKLLFVAPFFSWLRRKE
jgi:hypothetical protein